MFAVLPRVGEAIKIEQNLPAAYQVTFLTHKPVRHGEVSEYRPPHVEIVVTGYGEHKPVEKPE
jgi:hypothetical protein